ncbi:MAG: putative bifunctional DNA primase/polymerase [Prokaryotic dsDNA virus sp.]|nr:MAG: putative bifunctional DNA primase/polymerase [Prokaryotic dsDNA virus sp.]QDP53798.1 MAG: putative bifunctional DNA primase/polymerase [Prokaryotic dsDNA virus sp.]|tara:strand:- start:2101 stop:3765 length:1665 start_codon:yes stop_codon:yes gene_type:complete
MNFNELNIDLKGKTSGQIKTKCPKCHHKRKKKNDPSLSVDIDKGLYNCHHCGHAGSIKFKNKSEWILPKENKNKLSDPIVKWFKTRKINAITLTAWKITESITYFPQIEQRKKSINFNYYRDNKLINVKYRDRDKNFKLSKGAELIFYGLDFIKSSDTCYIVEGEIDALTLYQCGFYNVCSVPNGASKGNTKLDYLDNCYKYFENKKSIIICTDNDDAGLALRNELARRFGAYKCKYVDFKDCKDANDVLVSKDKETLLELIKSPKNFPLDGIVNINDIWDDVLNYNKKGIKTYDIGFECQDLFNLSLAQWTVLTGIPNHGKSDFLDQLMCNLAEKHNFRCAIFAPESFPYEGHIKRIANKLNGKNCDNDMLNATKDFISEHFYWVKIDLKNLTLESILKEFRELVFQRGINICVIDPWNMLDHTTQRDYGYIGHKLSLLTQFVQQTNTHLFLVAHPKKIESENGQFQKVDLYKISGSADFFNKTFNGLVCERVIGEKTEYGSDLVKIHIQKVKRKENGQLGTFTLAPDFNSGGVYKNVVQTKIRPAIKNNIPF